jgi:hypothetical protein
MLPAYTRGQRGRYSETNGESDALYAVGVCGAADNSIHGRAKNAATLLHVNPKAPLSYPLAVEMRSSAISARSHGRQTPPSAFLKVAGIHAVILIRHANHDQRDLALRSGRC